ncbi:Tripeptidyl-peptidase 2 [Trichinella pseudospiralis]|uniref:Tripeptidyl-peptidase 2 n=1 Tax=Trichinella pseudospiralis TaxID=6337 RepID=A0A0V0Y5N6_TRIPS|nr:Tripeptidyl-peptidase 2 [Trichinella pseudospiralis]
MDFDFGPDSELYSLFHRIPRDETELSEFQKSFSEYDGRGIVIAILDTGIDPSAPGMQVTSEGSPKIIDIVDLTGSGDVDTSTKRRAQDSVLVGLTGRKLMSEKRKKEWTPLHLLATADVARLVENFENKNGVDQTKYTLKTRLDKQDLDSAESLLKSVDEMEDYGPVADCIVFHNGTSWVACLDTTFKGQLSECRLMSSYREKQEFDILTKQADHGTHVAGIAAACHPDEPHRNGVAPGAQLISLQIGDHRLKGIETGTALLRAINYCIEHKVNIINYSFAESTHWEDDGKILDAIRDAAFNHDVIYVAAAGNEGPALTTVGCPGGSVDACVGITAYVSSAMRTKLYSLRDRLSPMFGWLLWSVGLCPWCRDNMRAEMVSLQLSVVQWNIDEFTKRCRLYRAAISPTMVKLAIENTAKPLEDIDDGCKLASGRGLLRVTEAFDYLKRFASKLERHVHYTVKVGDSGRGIYFRELAEVEQVHLITVNVKPVFSEKTVLSFRVEKCDPLAQMVFHSVQKVPHQSFHLNEDHKEKCSPVYKLMVKCGPRSERFQPIMNLKSITVPLKPVKHELRPMGPRDLFYDGKQIYQLLITYKFEIDKSCIVTPNVPLLSEHLYESDYCGYIWSIYDINNAYMFSGGSYPDRFSTKLEEGEYSMILQIRHYCKDALEQAKGTLATVNCKLATPIAVDSYENWPSSFKNAEKFTSCLLQRGEMKAIYFAFPTIENLPIHASAGSFLCGHLVMSRCELTKTALPVMFDVKLYVQMDMPKKKKKSFTLVPDVDRKISKLIHRYKVWLMARRGLTTSNMLYSELIEQESSDAVYCTLTRLIYLMKYQMANCQQEIYNLSIKLLNLIDRNQLIIFFGGNRDFDPDWVKRKNKMEYLKNVMLVALFAKGTVILSTIRKNFDQKLSDVSVACGALEFPKVLHDASGSYVGESTLSTDDSSTSNGSSEDNEVSSVEAQTQEAAAVSEKKKSENAEEQKPENWYASFKICDVEAILLEMLQLADMEHPLLIPFCCNYAIYTGRYFWAVALLDKLLKEDPKSKELKALKISLVQKIGWLHVADNLINGILVKHPPSQRLL